jgi:transmembrane sensor
MKPQSKMSDADQAAAWVARMDRDDWTSQDEVELQEWLARGPARAGALLQAQAAWMTLDPSGNADSAAIEKRRRTPSLTRRAFVGCGAVAAIAVGGWLWPARGVRYATELGEIRRIPLADGSIAALNTASEMEVRLAGRNREVRLTRGEAWFQVAKDPDRPFVVEAGDINVRAVGTAFSVRRREKDVEVLVTEGVVEAWLHERGVVGVRLTAGERILVSDGAIKHQPDVPSGIDRALAWRNGQIDLSGNTLASAIEEFNRYNRRRLILVDASIGGEEIDGVFRTHDPEGFAVAIQRGLNIPMDFRDPTMIRIGRTGS